MKHSDETTAIPKEVALALCQAIRRENQGKWYKLSAWQCWGCVTFTGGNPEKMCFSSRADNRGCLLVNARYARQIKEE